MRPKVSVAVHSSRQYCRSRKSTNIGVEQGAIWGIPAQKTANPRWLTDAPSRRILTPRSDRRDRRTGGPEAGLCREDRHGQDAAQAQQEQPHANYGLKMDANIPMDVPKQSPEPKFSPARPTAALKAAWSGVSINLISV
jgi:hypothetical protein